MKKMRTFLLGVCLLGGSSLLFAQAPSHEKYVKGESSEKSFSEAYKSWVQGQSLYPGDAVEEDEEFYISRVKPKARLVNPNVQVKSGVNPDRKLLWWCPIGTASGGNWNALPSYHFDSEVFTMWSYVDIYGNWTAPFVRMPAAFTDVCHKNGVKTSVVAAVPYGYSIAPGGTAYDPHGKNISALIDGGAEKLLKFLRYYGIDGIGFNSEFSSGSYTTGMKKLFGDAYSLKDEIWPTFHNAWYGWMTSGGSPGGADALTRGTNDEWFHYNGKTVSDAYFMNYNWGASGLGTSVSTAQYYSRNSFDVYGGMDFEGRSIADWLALQRYNISVGIWGSHDMNMIFLNRNELGAEATQRQKIYQLISENVFTGSSYNPVNTPPVTNLLAHTSQRKDFHGFSSFISARSAMWTDDLSKEPFVTYFNLGNGKFFNIEGVTTFANEWYNIGIQDYMPTWRWWWTSDFMGRTAEDVPASGLKAEFTWDDAWFGGSCLSISGQTDQEYLHLFKTQYPLNKGDKLLIRYKVLSGSGTLAWAVTAKDEEPTEVSGRIGEIVPDEEGWKSNTITVGTGARNLQMGGKILSMLGLKFTNTTNDFKVLIGEISLTRSAAPTPNKPMALTVAKIMKSNYKGVDFKVAFKMADRDAENNPIYNSDVNAWYYKIYMQQEGTEEPVMCTATTSWASYVVGAPYNVALTGKRVKIGVSAVSVDGNSESDIQWSDYLSVPDFTIVEGIEIDKPVIKPGEEFTVKFVDPNHAAAEKWQIVNSRTLQEKLAVSNVASITHSLDEVGIYDLILTENGEETKYQAYVQVSGEEVGALPEIRELKANGSTESVTLDKADGTPEVTYSYVGRPSDGSVSRGLLLSEKAFGVNVTQNGSQFITDTTPFSVAFWFNPRTYNHGSGGTQLLNIRTASDKWPASDWGFIWSTIQPDNTFSLSLRYRVANGGSAISVEDMTFAPGQWYHVALILDYQGGGRIMSLYVNGRLIKTADKVTDLYAIAPTCLIMIGGQAAHRAGIDGYLDEVQLYNSALTEEQVLKSMNHIEQNDLPSSLIGYWDFETDTDDNNLFASTGTDKNLKAGLVTSETLGEGNNQFNPTQTSYATGAPFIPGENFKIETKPEWMLSGATSTSDATGNSSAGSVKAVYNTTGIYEATLTLSNGWGSDTKKFSFVKIDDTTGLTEEAVSGNYKVFPNPFVEELNIQFVKAGTYAIEVANMAGQLVSQKDMIVSDGEFVRIAINGAKGNYLVSVKENGKLLKVFKVIKE